MTRLSLLPTWFKVALVALAGVFALRYLAAIESGATHGVAIRTYVFWALVCAPVAYLAEMLFETFMSYRLVQLAVARVKDTRTQR